MENETKQPIDTEATEKEKIEIEKVNTTMSNSDLIKYIYVAILSTVVSHFLIRLIEKVIERND